jgi:hypothetical protein
MSRDSRRYFLAIARTALALSNDLHRRPPGRLGTRPAKMIVDGTGTMGATPNCQVRPFRRNVLGIGQLLGSPRAESGA